MFVYFSWQVNGSDYDDGSGLGPDADLSDIFGEGLFGDILGSDELLPEDDFDEIGKVIFYS